jgi:hypothetical protein
MKLELKLTKQPARLDCMREVPATTIRILVWKIWRRQMTDNLQATGDAGALGRL